MARRCARSNCLTALSLRRVRWTTRCVPTAALVYWPDYRIVARLAFRDAAVNSFGFSVAALACSAKLRSHSTCSRSSAIRCSESRANWRPSRRAKAASWRACSAISRACSAIWRKSSFASRVSSCDSRRCSRRSRFCSLFFRPASACCRPASVLGVFFAFLSHVLNLPARGASYALCLRVIRAWISATISVGTASMVTPGPC